ncbi:hypothetical protein AMTRI_Chr10g224960 [Amborella trichopoda]|uniref:F-box domain-containing protein n=1 Tax=Amborella trichopoda TaxID=13333 RepID=W1NX69_AMBTC|nr:F-box protein At5g39250 [Amborella trichopoda]ERM99943.1 hypothetical protein AMTR_s00110p00109060 [Amborella trichopoda]|eukprot:XP_006837090.1 F-box protein At5g39250 [Amborella trichopoda]
MSNDWSHGEVLKAVFPLLDGSDLASCMCVCKQWRDTAKDDYLWRCLCAKKWPSICKKPQPPSTTYHHLFRTFSKQTRSRPLPPPKLTFHDLEFFIDLWSNDQLVFSEAIAGPILRQGIEVPPQGICEPMRSHLEGPTYKMATSVKSRFSMLDGDEARASVLVSRKDTNKIACIIENSRFDYVDRTAFRALAFDYLQFSPLYPFVSESRAWLSLLLVESCGGKVDVFGIEMDFCDTANSEEEVLWLLDMLEWK